MSRHRALSTFLVAAIAGLGLALGPLSGGPARGAAPDAIGFWSRTQVTPALPGAVPVTAPQPTVVPEGGLYVGGDPSGPTAVSAIRLELANGATATGDVVIPIERALGTVNVEACRVVVVWAAERNGRLENAPPPVCDQGRAPATVVTTPTGDVLRVPVAAFVSDERVNLRLQPVAGAVFQLTTRAPGTDAVTVADAPPATSGEPVAEPSAFEPAVLGDGSTVGAFEPFTPFPLSPASPDLAAIGAPPAPAPPTGVASPVFRSVGRPAVPIGSIGQARIRFIAALVAFDLAVFYLWLLRSPGRVPRLLGPFGGAQVVAASAVEGGPARGIGRFARARAAPPVRL